MTIEKCILKLAMESKLCEDLISKELLVLSSLIDEEGLRVSDIHAVLGGNKSWVSNLCSRLSRTGFAASTREGREVYYSLTENGSHVARIAFNLIQSLVNTEKIPYKYSENTYILYKGSNHDPQTEINKLLPPLPIHTHKGAILFNEKLKTLIFIGKDQRNKLLNLEIPLQAIEKIDLAFNSYYKRRKKPAFTPLIIHFKIPDQEDANKENYQTLYLFTDFQTIGRPTKNSEWFDFLSKELELESKSREQSAQLEESETDLTQII